VQLSECLTEEFNNLIDEKQLRPRRLWASKWIRRRETRGASALLLKELSVEDPQEYRLCLRKSIKEYQHTNSDLQNKAFLDVRLGRTVESSTFQGITVPPSAGYSS